MLGRAPWGPLTPGVPLVTHCRPPALRLPTARRGAAGGGAGRAGLPGLGGVRRPGGRAGGDDGAGRRDRDARSSRTDGEEGSVHSPPRRAARRTVAQAREGAPRLVLHPVRRRDERPGRGAAGSHHPQVDLAGDLHRLRRLPRGPDGLPVGRGHLGTGLPVERPRPGERHLLDARLRRARQRRCGGPVLPHRQRQESLYSAAIKDALTRTDNGPSTADINASFTNANVGFYFGTDGAASSSQYDFKSVVLHELGHGLGFSGSFDVVNGRAGSSTRRTRTSTTGTPSTPRRRPSRRTGSSTRRTRPPWPRGCRATTSGGTGPTPRPPTAERGRGSTRRTRGTTAAASRTGTRPPTRPATPTRS